MKENIVLTLINLTGLYLLLGFVFSLLFLWKGLEKVDEGAKGTSRFFKLLLVPGLCVFWVLFLKKWWRTTKK
ncbi:MAG: hypothetical protein AAGJ18_10435 [Bacteroidota bacterium]